MCALTSAALFTACGVAAEPDESGSAPAPSTSESGTEAAEAPRFDRALLSVADIADARDVDVEKLEDEPVSPFLTVTQGFEITGECADIIDDVNAYSTPAVQAFTAAYEFDEVTRTPSPEPSESASSGASSSPESSDSPSPSESGEAETVQPSVETMVFQTADDTTPLKQFSEVADKCGTVDSTDDEDTKLKFEAMDEVDAVRLVISSDGHTTETITVGGSTVSGKFHFYTVTTNMTKGQAQQILDDQREQLADYVADEASHFSNTSGDAEPSESVSSPSGSEDADSDSGDSDSGDSDSGGATSTATIGPDNSSPTP